MKLAGKKASYAFALVLFAALCVSLFTLPTAQAHTPAWSVPTWTYIAVQNSVIGVNQPFLVIFWTNCIPPTANGAYGDRWTFTLEITKPDGTKQVVSGLKSDPIGGGYLQYTAEQTGTYTFVAKFDGKTVTGLPLPPGRTTPFNGADYVNDTYLPSSSNPLTVTVQQQAIQSWSETPLPTEWWKRPINSANREWYVLAGNWLGTASGAHNVGPTARFSYGLGPESAHVMWATPMWAGGIMDARFGYTGYQTGHYEGIGFQPPIILNGKIYYNVRSYPREGWYCLDLYTGKVEYFHNTTGPVTGIGGGFAAGGSIAGESLAFGQIYDYESPNQHGGFPYLWSTTYPGQANTWMMFDAYSGNYICSITNVTQTERRGTRTVTTGATGTAVYGKDGSILRYNIVNLGTTTPEYYLQVWNTSQVIMSAMYDPTVTNTTNAYWMWRPILNYTYDGRKGFSLNVSIPAVQGTVLAVREDQFIIGGTAGKNNGTYIEQGNLWALSLKPGEEGKLLWNITFTPPQTAPDIAIGSGLTAAGVTLAAVDPEDGVFLFNERLTLRWWGYDLNSGQKLWGPSAPEPDLNYYGMYNNIYRGKLYTFGYGGVLIAYDVKTGKVLWNYTASQVGFESPYGNYPFYLTAVVDGKLYMVSGEHSLTQPLWRGPNLRCVDAETGKELWKILFMGAGDGGAHLTATTVVAADGYIVGLNYFDNRIYCFGKGPSATTVTVSPKVAAKGTSVLIEGTVTDESPGAKEIVQSGRLPAVAAVSDESQEDWMEYLYMQQARPTNATGVPVKVQAVAPDGRVIDIGTATSTADGNFAIAWTPPAEGQYWIRAVFEGSKAYYGSHAETAVYISAAAPSPSATPVTPTISPSQSASPSISPTVAPPTGGGAPAIETYVVAAAVVAAIVVVVAVLLLKKRSK